MSACADNCPLEAVSQDAESIGVITDDEVVLRGAFDPSHGNAATLNIKPGVISSKDLLAGTLSVYRGEPKGVSVGDLKPILVKSRPENTLFAIASVRVEVLRSVRLASGGRAFCVLDECECDRDGNKHPAHAHISLCRAYLASGVEMDDPFFVQALQDVRKLFRDEGATVWSEQKKAA